MFKRGREPKAPKNPAASSDNTEVSTHAKSPLHRLRLHLHRYPDSPSSSKEPESADDVSRDPIPQNTTSASVAVSTDLSKTSSQPSVEENKSTNNTRSVSGLKNVQSPTAEHSPVSVHDADDSQSLI